MVPTVATLEHVLVHERSTRKCLAPLWEFYARCFRENHPLLNRSLFDWYFMRAPNQWSVVVAKDKDKVVGHIGIVPVKLRVQGMLFRAAWCINIYVMPEMTGAGLGSAMVEAGLKQYDLVFGVGSTDQGLRLYRRNGYFLLGNLHRYVRVISALTAQNLLLESSRAALWLLQEAEQKKARVAVEAAGPIHCIGPTPFRVPSGYLSLWHRFSQRFVATVERTPTYLEWRFGRNPDLRYRCLYAINGDSLVGLLVFRVDYAECSSLTPVIRILDLIADTDAVCGLLNALERYALSIAAAVVEFFCSSPSMGHCFESCGYLATPHPLTYELSRLYHPPRPTAPVPIPFSIKPNDQSQDLPVQLIRSLDSWYVTLADSDLDRIQR